MTFYAGNASKINKFIRAKNYLGRYCKKTINLKEFMIFNFNTSRPFFNNSTKTLYKDSKSFHSFAS